MKTTFIILLVGCSIFYGCNHKTLKMECQDEKCKSPTNAISCKLTTPELQQRQATILLSLRNQVIEKKELENGYAFKFPGSDTMIDELTAFVKTERLCCDFLKYNFLVTGDTTSLWFEITGPKGAKEFIGTELEL